LNFVLVLFLFLNIILRYFWIICKVVLVMSLWAASIDGYVGYSGTEWYQVQ